MSATRRADRSKQRHSPITADTLERQPPCDIEAELGVLGSMMLKPDVCDEIAPLLREIDFYDPAHQRLFSHMMEMHTSGKRIDVTLLVDRLKKSGDYELVGGPAYLARVSQAVPNAAHAKYYANIVHEKSTYRSLIDASTDILQNAYGQSVEAKELLSSAETAIFSLMDKRTFHNVSSIRDVLLEAMERIDARLKGEQITSGVETGFSDLDELTGGLHNSELIILAARPSMGKTALAMNIASNVALDQDCAVLFVSLEMSSLELADRMLCSVGRIDGHKLRNGRLPSDQRRRLVEVASRISQAPLYVDDSPSRTVTEIAAAARRIGRREEKLGLIVIDYLQLIEPDNPSDPRQEQVAKIARRLKGMARELKVPVLCLAQVNRQAEDAREHRPRLSHLRESGAIEQDADVVMFVHREEYYQRGEDREQHAGQAEVIIAKQRNGPVGDVELVWRKEYTRFEDRAPARLEEFDSYADPVSDSDF
jgi:replicative DNA helicase